METGPAGQFSIAQLAKETASLFYASIALVHEIKLEHDFHPTTVAQLNIDAFEPLPARLNFLRTRLAPNVHRGDAVLENAIEVFCNSMERLIRTINTTVQALAVSTGDVLSLAQSAREAKKIVVDMAARELRNAKPQLEVIRRFRKTPASLL